MPTGQNLISTKDVSRRLNVTVSTVSRMVTRGSLEPVMKMPGVSGAYLFDPEAIDQYIARRGAGV